MTTKYGGQDVDSILFIASGAFRVVQALGPGARAAGPPIRVDLHALGERSSSSSPSRTLIRQYTACSPPRMSSWCSRKRPSARWHIAVQVNKKTEDIGARRLHGDRAGAGRGLVRRHRPRRPGVRGHRRLYPPPADRHQRERGRPLHPLERRFCQDFAHGYRSGVQLLPDLPRRVPARDLHLRRLRGGPGERCGAARPARPAAGRPAEPIELEPLRPGRRGPLGRIRQLQALLEAHGARSPVPTTRPAARTTCRGADSPAGARRGQPGARPARRGAPAHHRALPTTATPTGGRDVRCRPERHHLPNLRLPFPTSSSTCPDCGLNA